MPKKIINRIRPVRQPLHEKRCVDCDELFMAHSIVQVRCPDCQRHHYNVSRRNGRSTRKPLEEVLESFRAVWGDRFDYSKVEYVNMATPVTVICKVHGEFKVSSWCHTKKKNGCIKCRVSSKRMTTEQLISRSTEKFGDKFEYISECTTSETPFVFRCKKHGEFTTTPKCHLVSIFGCPQCAKEGQDYGIGSLGPYTPKTIHRHNGKKCFLYLMRLSSEDEVFYKVGLTKNIKRRMSCIDKRYDIEVKQLVQGELPYLFSLEQKILGMVDKYNPSIAFGGHAECFKELNFRRIQ